MFPSQQRLSHAFADIDLQDHARAHLGDVYNIVHPAPNRPETPPSPLSTVPFPRDPDFVDRGSLLSEIDQKLANPAARVALVGLGGVGKSQLAIEYAYRKRDVSTDTWVLWIHASSAARFEQSLRDVLDRLKTPGRSDPEANVFQLFKNWLCDATKGKWLVVLDNADDDSFLLETPTTLRSGEGKTQHHSFRERRLDYLPVCDHGSILITTRSRAAGLRMVEQNCIVGVGPMEKEHALTLMERKLGGLYDQEEVVRLAGELEFLPLAMVQAAAYIRQRAPRCTVGQYIEKLGKNEKSRLSLLNRDEGDLRRDREARNSIVLTWEISFEHIRQARRSAADLLSLMSFFDRQAIPETLLKNRTSDRTQFIRSKATGQYSRTPHSDIDSWVSDEDSEDTSGAEDDEFEEDIAMLRDYSFVSITADVTAFEMHRLVQFATQQWLKIDDSFERWGLQFMSNLDKVFPPGHYENWKECRRLFPHAMMAFQTKLIEEEAIVAQASLLLRSGLYASGIGAYIDAERMTNKSKAIRERVLGDEHPDTTKSKANLARTYSNQGRWSEAEKLELEVVETSKRMLGDEHPNTITRKANLALTYWNQGRWSEAEKLELEVVETSKRVLGDEHPDTITRKANLASTYSDQGRWSEAEKLELEVVETSKRVLGGEHPDTIMLKANLALTYWNQGRWSEAEKLGLEVVETSKRVLGDEHPDTITRKANLASMYSDQGRWSEAEKLELEVVEMSKRVLGHEHPNTIMLKANLASTYWNQGQWSEAEKLELEVVETSKRILGGEHPNTITCKANLARTYSNQGRWSEAEKLELEVVETSKRVLGDEHPSTITRKATLARMYKNQGQSKEATSLAFG